ncbi:MAG: FtsX-like permease family protein [bacterium]|nr:FtsX-like permease family protein [bacterium]
MSRFFFYWQYALRNLWRNRRWSAFAIFSVAAGVATVVALRSLGLAIEDALTSNVRASNHGDITLLRGSSIIFGTIDSPEDAEVFSPSQLTFLRDWVAQRGGTMAEYISTGKQVSAVDAAGAGTQTVGRLQLITTFFIDPATYPPTQDIRASDPSNVPLGELFQGTEDEVVVSENFAEAQGIEVGDQVRISGTDMPFVVRGIVPTQAEAGLRDIFSAFFGFVYLDRSQAESLSVNPLPNRISIALPDGTTSEEILAASREIQYVADRTITVPRLIEQNQVIADLTGRFVVIMGLGAMLIGGVGIINTMLVMVRRRTEEIAALKTFGLKGRQVAMLFMAEALLLGFVGSLLGGVLGTLMSALTNAYGETFIQQPLTWRLYPEALLFGLVLGLVVTGVFGVLPVLTAVRIRPAIILRPNEPHIPAVGVLQGLGAIIFVVVSLGIIAGQILGPFPDRVPGPRRFSDLLTTTFASPTLVGIIGVAATLAILGLLVGLLWLIVWLVGKLPSFGWVDLRLALRNLSTRRTRTATTLLALSAGMFALSSITFVGAGIREILQITISSTFGGNILIFPLLPPQIAQPLIEGRLESLEGVEYRTLFTIYDGRVAEIDGRTTAEIAQAAAAAAASATTQPQDTGRGLSSGQPPPPTGRLPRQNVYVNLSMRYTDNPNYVGGEVVAGRALTLEDTGQPVALVQLTEELQPLGIQVGSTLMLEVDRQVYTFTVVGLLSEDSPLSSNIAFGDIIVPDATLPGANFDTQLNVVQASDEALNDVLVGIASLPLVFPLDITFVDGILSRFIEQFSALPILVGILSLGAAAVIMANTVALATLERRRQIGILKAIGLKGRRVLRVMLLENLVVTLLGGVIGIGLSALGVGIMRQLADFREFVHIPDEAIPVALALVAAAVVIGALATFLSANVAIRERVLNVLRYE